MDHLLVEQKIALYGFPVAVIIIIVGVFLFDAIGPRIFLRGKKASYQVEKQHFSKRR